MFGCISSPGLSLRMPTHAIPTNSHCRSRSQTHKLATSLAKTRSHHRPGAITSRPATTNVSCSGARFMYFIVSLADSVTAPSTDSMTSPTSSRPLPNGAPAVKETGHASCNQAPPRLANTGERWQTSHGKTLQLASHGQTLELANWRACVPSHLHAPLTPHKLQLRNWCRTIANCTEKRKPMVMVGPKWALETLS